MTNANKILEQYCQEFPHYSDFLDLLQKIYDLREENKSLWREDIFSLDQTQARQKLQADKPLINLQQDHFNDKLPKRYFLDLLTIAEQISPESVQGLRETILSNDLAYSEMVRNLFSQSNKDYKDKALPPEKPRESFDLVSLFLQESLKPFFSHLSLKQKEILNQKPWGQGICPVCSRLADLSLLRDDAGKRSLVCLQCDFEWPYKRLQCHFCGNEDQSKLDYFTFESRGQDHYRVNVCRQCQRFIKTIDTRTMSGEINLEVENLITIHLELEAAREGFR